MPFSAKQTRFIKTLTQYFLEEIRFIEAVRCGRATRRETVGEQGVNAVLAIASNGGAIGSATSAILAFGSKAYYDYRDAQRADNVDEDAISEFPALAQEIRRAAEKIAIAYGDVIECCNRSGLQNLADRAATRIVYYVTQAGIPWTSTAFVAGVELGQSGRGIDGMTNLALTVIDDTLTSAHLRVEGVFRHSTLAYQDEQDQWHFCAHPKYSKSTKLKQLKSTFTTVVSDSLKYGLKLVSIAEAVSLMTEQDYKLLTGAQHQAAYTRVTELLNQQVELYQHPPVFMAELSPSDCQYELDALKVSLSGLQRQLADLRAQLAGEQVDSTSPWAGFIERYQHDFARTQERAERERAIHQFWRTVPQSSVSEYKSLVDAWQHDQADLSEIRYSVWQQDLCTAALQDVETDSTLSPISASPVHSNMREYLPLLSSTEHQLVWHSTPLKHYFLAQALWQHYQSTSDWQTLWEQYDFHSREYLNLFLMALSGEHDLQPLSLAWLESAAMPNRLHANIEQLLTQHPHACPCPICHTKHDWLEAEARRVELHTRALERETRLITLLDQPQTYDDIKTAWARGEHDVICLRPIHEQDSIPSHVLAPALLEGLSPNLPVYQVNGTFLGYKLLQSRWERYFSQGFWNSVTETLRQPVLDNRSILAIVPEYQHLQVRHTFAEFNGHLQEKLLLIDQLKYISAIRTHLTAPISDVSGDFGLIATYQEAKAIHRGNRQHEINHALQQWRLLTEKDTTESDFITRVNQAVTENSPLLGDLLQSFQPGDAEPIDSSRLLSTAIGTGERQVRVNSRNISLKDHSVTMKDSLFLLVQDEKKLTILAHKHNTIPSTSPEQRLIDQTIITVRQKRLQIILSYLLGSSVLRDEWSVSQSPRQKYGEQVHVSTTAAIIYNDFRFSLMTSLDDDLDITENQADCTLFATPVDWTWQPVITSYEMHERSKCVRDSIFWHNIKCDYAANRDGLLYWQAADGHWQKGTPAQINEAYDQHEQQLKEALNVFAFAVIDSQVDDIAFRSSQTTDRLLARINAELASHEQSLQQALRQCQAKTAGLEKQLKAFFEGQRIRLLTMSVTIGGIDQPRLSETEAHALQQGDLSPAAAWLTYQVQTQGHAFVCTEIKNEIALSERAAWQAWLTTNGHLRTWQAQENPEAFYQLALARMPLHWLGVDTLTPSTSSAQSFMQSIHEGINDALSHYLQSCSERLRAEWQDYWPSIQAQYDLSIKKSKPLAPLLQRLLSDLDITWPQDFSAALKAALETGIKQGFTRGLQQAGKQHAWNVLPSEQQQVCLRALCVGDARILLTALSFTITSPQASLSADLDAANRSALQTALNRFVDLRHPWQRLDSHEQERLFNLCCQHQWSKLEVFCAEYVVLPNQRAIESMIRFGLHPDACADGQNLLQRAIHTLAATPKQANKEAYQKEFTQRLKLVYDLLDSKAVSQYPGENSPIALAKRYHDSDSTTDSEKVQWADLLKSLHLFSDVIEQNPLLTKKFNERVTIYRSELNAYYQSFDASETTLTGRLFRSDAIRQNREGQRSSLFEMSDSMPRQLSHLYEYCHTLEMFIDNDVRAKVFGFSGRASKLQQISQQFLIDILAMFGLTQQWHKDKTSRNATTALAMAPALGMQGTRSQGQVELSDGRAQAAIQAAEVLSGKDREIRGLTFDLENERNTVRVKDEAIRQLRGNLRRAQGLPAESALPRSTCIIL